MKGLIVLWAPRVAGIVISLFLSLFALDAFGQAKGVIASLPGFALHLIPAFLVLAIVVLAWRRPLWGAVAFLALATLYAAATLRRPDWILAIGGPLAIAGLLYLASWFATRKPQAP